MTTKYASPYSMIRQPLQKVRTYSTYDARNKQTGQIWLARVINTQTIRQFGLEQHVDYLEQTLLNLKDKEHVVYVQEIFSKNNNTFIIQQKHQIRLSQYLSRKEKIACKQVENIMKDIFQGLCDIYEEGYIHRNIRPEHVVLFSSGNGVDEVWKIETLVLDNKQFAVDTPFAWKKSTASPEERNQKDQLDQQKLDSQIVWNFGYLALSLLMGYQFTSKLINNDSDISWGKVKDLTIQSPALYQLIDRSVRVKFTDRIPLNKFFNLKIFDDLSRIDIGQYFITASKIFKNKQFSSIQLSMNMKSKNLKSQVQKPSPAKKQFAQIQQVNEQAVQQQDVKSAAIGTFIMNAPKFIQLVNCKEWPQAKINQNRLILQFYFLKLSMKYLQTIKTNSKINIQNGIRQQSESKINTQSKLIKRIKTNDNALLKKFAISPQQNYDHTKLIKLVSSLCGFAYSRLKDECQLTYSGVKLKAMAFFGIAGYMLNVEDWQDLEVVQSNQKIDYFDFFDKSTPQDAVKLSQTLIRKYFRIAL